MSLGIFKKGKGSYKSDKTLATKEDIYLVKVVDRTSQLTNDGENGTDKFISIKDLVNTNNSGIISGNGISWIEGYTFEVSSYTYGIRGKVYTAPITRVTLDASDAVLNRTDVIVGTFDNEGKGYIKVIKGTNGAIAVKPFINQETEIEITTIDIDANTTQPSNLTSNVIYNEGTESTFSDNTGGRVDYAFLTSPFIGTKSIKATNFTSGDIIEFLLNAEFIPATYEAFQFQIASLSGKWQNNGTIKLGFFKDATRVSEWVIIDSNITNQAGNPYAFDSINTAWQNVFIPFNVFNFSGSANKLVIQKDDNRGTDTFKLDLIRLQGGVGGTSPIILVERTDQLQNTGANNTSTYVEHNELADVATTGSYNDLLDKPIIKQGIENRYADITALFADQVNQTNKGIQFVADATGDITVITGYAYYEYLGTTVGNITDYRKLSEQETMDLIPITTTSQLTNDGADGINPFISANDVVIPLAEKLAVSATHLTGLTFTVNADRFPAGGLWWTSVQGDVTLDASDVTFDRFDLLVARTNGIVGKITGEASASPLQPNYDAETEYPIRFVLVQANVTTVGGYSKELVFDENTGEPTEYTFSTTTPASVGISTLDKYSGLSSILAINSNAPHILFTNNVNNLTKNISGLTWWLKLRSSYGQSNLNVYFYLDNNLVWSYAFKNGKHGFDSSLLVWQKIIIDIELLNIPLGEFNKIILSASKSGHNGFYIDEVELHLNTTIVTPPSTDIIKNTSQLINDGENGTDKFARESQLHTHENKTVLDSITQGLIDAWQSASTWVVDNGANVLTHLGRTDNPHGVTKAQVGLENVTNDAQIPLALKGSPLGVAELDAQGFVVNTQLPSYIDDVLEFANLASFPVTGESGKIYIAIDTNITYRWSGTVYAPIGSDLALGETALTAYRGDRGKIAYDHSQTTHDKTFVGLGNVENATASLLYEPIFTKNTAFNKNFGSTAGTVAEGNHNHNTAYLGINAKASDSELLDGLDSTAFALSGHNHSGVYEPANANIQAHISSTSNPHGVTKAQVGLSNVDNTSDLNKPISTATQTALDLKANITDLLPQNDLAYGQAILDNHRSRVLADLGKSEPSNAAYQLGLMKNQNLLRGAKILMLPTNSKAGKLHSIKPIDGTGDFTVSRPASSGFAGTRINEDGLIENVDADVPRIDFTNGCGELLTEPQSVNLITYPRSFDNAYWTKSNVEVSADSTFGDEKIINGAFDTDTNWTKSTNATINGGVATLTANSGNVYIQQTNLWGANTFNKKHIRVTYTVTQNTLNAGDLKIGGFGGSDFINTIFLIPKTVGTHNIDLQVLGSINENSITIYIQSGSTSGLISLDDISIKEVKSFPSPHVQYPTSAFKLVATSANGFIRKITTGINASPYSNIFWIKRLVGTGQVSLIGVNNVDMPITLTTEWQLFSSTVTSTSTSIYSGVKLATSGDEVMIAFAQLEQQSYATSLMMPVTEGSTQQRNADVVTVNPPTGTTQILEMINGVDISRTVATPYTVSLNRIQKITMQ